MKLAQAVIGGVVLAILAGSASAQWRRHEGPGGPAPRGFPAPMRVQRPAPAPHGPPPLGAPIFPNDSLGAGWSAQQDAVRAGVRQRRFVPLGQAIESIRRRGPGRELDAGLEEWQGRPAYRVRWAEPDGRRIDYMVDAESGAILGVDEGH